MTASNRRLVLFDLDDVLCRYDRAHRLRLLSSLSGSSVDNIERRIWASGFEEAADAGAISADDYLAGFGARLGAPLSRDTWANVRGASMTPWPEALVLVAAVKQRARIAILTNNGFLFGEMLDAMFPELRPLFGKNILTSAQYGIKKPDPEVFRRALVDLGATPEETLFIDDKAWNVEGAIRAGLKGHVFSNIATLAAWLRDEGIVA
jgi:glucose-1-phosphatase